MAKKNSPSVHIVREKSRNLFNLHRKKKPFVIQFKKIQQEEGTMENTRVAILGIIISDMDSVEPVNALLHENSPYIIGRMGLPYRERGINIISIVLDAPQQIISTLSGRIGRLSGISCKVTYSRE